MGVQANLSEQILQMPGRVATLLFQIGWRENLMGIGSDVSTRLSSGWIRPALFDGFELASSLKQAEHKQAIELLIQTKA